MRSGDWPTARVVPRSSSGIVSASSSTSSFTSRSLPNTTPSSLEDKPHPVLVNGGTTTMARTTASLSSSLLPLSPRTGRLPLPTQEAYSRYPLRFSRGKCSAIPQAPFPSTPPIPATFLTVIYSPEGCFSPPSFAFLLAQRLGHVVFVTNAGKLILTRGNWEMGEVRVKDRVIGTRDRRCGQIHVDTVGRTTWVRGRTVGSRTRRGRRVRDDVGRSEATRETS